MISQNHISRHGRKYMVSFYEASEKPLATVLDGVCKCVHMYGFHEGKMAIVWNKGRDVWSPPGGGVEPGETIIDAIHREVREETGAKIRALQYVGVLEFIPDDGGKDIEYHARFAGVLELQSEKYVDPDDEIGEIKFVDISEADKILTYAHDEHIHTKVRKMMKDIMLESVN